MSNGLKIVLAIVVVAALALGTLLITGGQNGGDPAPDAQPGETARQQGQMEQDAQEQVEQSQAEATISYTDSGFSPAQITVPAGSTVEVKNESQSTLQFASDEHPTHTDNNELNVGIIEPGSSATFVVAETGTWGYHNHLNDAHGGEIVVE